MALLKLDGFIHELIPLMLFPRQKCRGLIETYSLRYFLFIVKDFHGRNAVALLKHTGIGWVGAV